MSMVAYLLGICRALAQSSVLAPQSKSSSVFITVPLVGGNTVKSLKKAKLLCKIPTLKHIAFGAQPHISQQQGCNLRKAVAIRHLHKAGGCTIINQETQ